MKESAGTGLAAEAQPTPPEAAPRQRAVAWVVGLGVLALVPGVLVRLDAIDRSTTIGRMLGELGRALEPITFGAGLRFWLGIAGASMMALLLLYPLRKAFGVGRGISVAAWFRLHVMLGVAGPVLILYHCFFGTGSTPANVALASTLIVALSGIFGHFVYARISARFHGARREAEARRGDVVAELQGLRHTSSRAGFLDELAVFERHALPEKRSPLRAVLPAAGLAGRQRELVARGLWLIDNQGPQDGWSAAECRDAKAHLAAALEAYFATLARAARGSGFDWLASSWRLLHMPVFCILVIAAGVHVSRVWNMEGRAPPEAVAPAATAVPGLQPAPARPGPAVERRSPIATRRVATVPEGAARGSTAEAPRPPQSTDAVVQRPVKTQTAGNSSASGDGAPSATARSAPAADPVAELQRRGPAAGDNRLLDPAAIRQRLAELKADATFDHGKTRFALVGKHRTVACESCHKTALKDNDQRCIACHKKDDVHRGRRQECASCHTPVDWSEIRRR